MIDKFAAAFEALTQANEDEFGLWEVLWALNYQYPQETHLHRLEESIEAVRTLFRLGLVKVSYGHTTPGHGRAVPPEEFEGVINNLSSWTPQTEPQIWCITTDAGEAAWAERGAGLRRLMDGLI